MQARRINESEFKRTEELFHIAFEFEYDEPLSNDEIIAKKKANPMSRGDRNLLEKWAAFDDDGSMMAWISALPFEVNFDGNTVRMGGIGGVSSLPQYRRAGAIRACFNTCLRDIYDDGHVLSYLYPFSSAYYRKFGYELCCESIQYSISLRAIKPFPEADGTMHLSENGSLLEDFKRVYEGFCDGYNMMCVRQDYDYRDVIKNNPAKDREYFYIYRDRNGVPKGAISFAKVQNDGHFDMQARTFWFTDLEGFKGLLNHTQAFAAYYENLTFVLPTDMRIASLVPEWALYPYKRQMNMHGMVRVVNVEKALMLAKYRGSGSIVIGVTDEQLVENNARFKVVFADDKAVSCERCNDACDVEMSVADFSRLLMGTHDPVEFKYLEGVKLHCPLEKAAQVFYKKPCFIADYF